MRELVLAGLLLASSAFAQETFGAWTLEENIVGGVNRSFVGATSSDGAAILYVRCSPIDLSAGVEWFLYVGQPLGVGASFVVKYSVGDGRVIPSPWGASADRTAVFGEGWEFDIIAMAVAFQGAEELTMSVAADWGEPTFTFSLAGLEDGVKALGCYQGAVPLS